MRTIGRVSAPTPSSSTPMIDHPKRIRINLRLPADLVRFAKRVAAQRRTTLTQVIVSLLIDMKEELKRV